MKQLFYFLTTYSTSPTGSENHLSPLRFQTFNRKVFWNRNEARWFSDPVCEVLDISKLDACDKLVKDAQNALRNNHWHRPTSSKFQKAQKEWDIILNDYIVAARLRYVAVQKWNDPKAAYDSSVGEAQWDAETKEWLKNNFKFFTLGMTLLFHFPK